MGKKLIKTPFGNFETKIEKHNTIFGVIDLKVIKEIKEGDLDA